MKPFKNVDTRLEGGVARDYSKLYAIKMMKKEELYRFVEDRLTKAKTKEAKELIRDILVKVDSFMKPKEDELRTESQIKLSQVHAFIETMRSFKDRDTNDDLERILFQLRFLKRNNHLGIDDEYNEKLISVNMMLTKNFSGEWTELNESINRGMLFSAYEHLMSVEYRDMIGDIDVSIINGLENEVNERNPSTEDLLKELAKEIKENHAYKPQFLIDLERRHSFMTVKSK